MDREKRIFLREFKSKNCEFAVFLKEKSLGNSKSSEASVAFRKSGNTLFLQKGHSAKIHRQIFNYYCQSVITAPNGSDQLAFAYGNRSALLLHMKKYEDCIKDCNRALKIINADVFKVKMLCRKAECLIKMSSPEFKSVLQEAENCRNQLEDDDNNKESLTETIDKLKALSLSKKNFAIKNVNVDQIELDENFDGIKIEYNQKYGRHLIATKDYKPGDIILVENLFATTVSENVRYTNCHHCLKICWSGVPCKHCSWAIFCSEDCRHQAWKLFHDIECPLYSFLKKIETLWNFSDTAIRAIISGIRQAGSIAQLKADLKLIDECSEDQYSKGFIKEGEYTKNRIESVYVLNSNRVPDHILKSVATCASMIVIGIAQHSQLFTMFDSTNIDEFIKNKEVTFLGSLIIKILAVKSINDCSFSPKQLYSCEKSKSLNQCRGNSCCVRGTCFTPISSLASHNCYPNAGRCFSEDRKVILYAVQPIEKNTQIFNSYSCEFDDNPLAERKLILQKYDIVCDCQACVESWQPIIHLSDELLERYGYSVNSTVENEIYKECGHIFDALDQRKINFNKKDIQILSKASAKVSKLKKPSKLMCILAESMKRVFSHVYGLKLQLNSFSGCKKSA